MTLQYGKKPLRSTITVQGSSSAYFLSVFEERVQSHLQCFLWSQCWGISCWCTWWPSPCPYLLAGEGVSLGRHRSVTKDAATMFTEWWRTLFSLILSTATFQVSWGQPSELLQSGCHWQQLSHVKRKCLVLLHTNVFITKQFFHSDSDKSIPVARLYLCCWKEANKYTTVVFSWGASPLIPACKNRSHSTSSFSFYVESHHRLYLAHFWACDV